MLSACSCSFLSFLTRAVTLLPGPGELDTLAQRIPLQHRSALVQLGADQQMIPCHSLNDLANAGA